MSRSLRAVAGSAASPGPEQESRSLAVSYLLWSAMGLGLCGLHRFYNRRPLSGLLWLVSFGLCGFGQLLDLLLMPGLVQQANRRPRPGEAATMPAPVGAEAMALSLERQLLLLARRAGPQGFTLNDALVDLPLPRTVDSTIVRAEIERLLYAELLEVGNDERGRVIYREP